MRISIEEIARKAGVSKTTVSLVMNKKAREQRISPETEAKVLAAVQKYGYEPDHFARSFRLKSTKTIGLLVGDVTNRFFSLLEESIVSRARANGYSVIIASSNDKEELENEALANLFSRSVDGAIVVSVMPSDSGHRKLNGKKVPVVYLDRSVKGASLQVVSDNFKGASDLTYSLIQRGYRDIAFLGGTSHLSSNSERLRGYKAALADNDLTAGQNRIFEDTFTAKSGYALVQQLFSIGPQPQAIFAAGMTLLEGVFRFLREQGPHFGRDIKLATFDDHPLIDFLNAKIDTVRQDCASLGESAFDLLIGAITGSVKKKTVVVPTQIFIRN